VVRLVAPSTNSLPEHDTEDEAAARFSHAPLSPLPPEDEDNVYEVPGAAAPRQHRAQPADSGLDIRGLDVEEDLCSLAATTARRPANKKLRDADFVPDEQEAAAHTRSPTSPFRG